MSDHATDHATDRATDPGALTTAAVYSVTGMTCAHCEGAVREEVAALPGVTGVAVDLVAGGTSTLTVTSTAPVPPEAVAAAVDEAGYHLVQRS